MLLSLQLPATAQAGPALQQRRACVAPARPCLPRLRCKVSPQLRQHRRCGLAVRASAAVPFPAEPVPAEIIDSAAGPPAPPARLRASSEVRVS